MTGDRDSQLLLDLSAPTGTELVVHERISARARQVRVEVRRDGTVLLVIPRRMARAVAWRFFEQHREWALAKSREWRQRAAAAPRPAPLRWDGTDRLWLEGRELPLRLESGRAAFGWSEEGAVLSTTAREPGALSRTLRRRLVEQARARARTLLDAESGRLGLRYRALRIGDPVSLWGSCGADGGISLSWRLLMAPPEVFRYVVIHELCHLRWRSHGPRFWGLVARQMPEYETHRRWLREHGAMLHGLFSSPRKQGSREFSETGRPPPRA